MNLKRQKSDSTLHFFTSSSLPPFTFVSLLIHLIFFTMAFLLIKRNDQHLMPSPYVVNLVSPDSAMVQKGESLEERGEKTEVRRHKSEDRSHPLTSSPSQPSKSLSSRRDEENISERIEAIRAKKRIEEIARLRNVISLQASGGVKKGGSPQGMAAKAGGSLTDDYYSKITSEIWQHWVYPETGNRNIEAVIVIKILKDGSVHIKGFEKSSGNSLFDRSAIRAITKAAPLTPPPYEMEIGVRFYP